VISLLSLLISCIVAVVIAASLDTLTKAAKVQMAAACKTEHGHGVKPVYVVCHCACHRMQPRV
jgi:hypothetical protein